MATPKELENKIKRLDWAGLRDLWVAVQAGNPPGWEGGEALEYLVLRAFELDKSKPIVRYPYEVSLFGEKVEEIDGAVHLPGLACLVESKDWGKNVPIGPIVKMRSQLFVATSRRDDWPDVRQANVYQTSRFSRPFHDAPGDSALVGLGHSDCTGRRKFL